MKNCGIILAVIICILGGTTHAVCADSPAKGDSAQKNTHSSPLEKGRVDFLIDPATGHLLAKDDTGIVVDLDNVVYMFVKIRNLMLNNIEKTTVVPAKADAENPGRQSASDQIVPER